MKGSTALGLVVIVLLFLSFGYSVASSVYPPFVREEKPVEAFREYTLTRSQTGEEVAYVQLEVEVKRGGVNMSFVEDEELIYKIRVEDGKDLPEPTVSYTKTEEGLLVEVLAEEGEFEVVLGSGSAYNVSVKAGLGGLSARLTEASTLDSLKLQVAYVGGLSLEVLDGASFNRLDLKVNTGGIWLKVERPRLQGNATVSARVEVGGILLESFTLPSPVGGRLTATVETGGIALNSRGFQVVKSTATEGEIRTSNYGETAVELNADLQVGVGGIAVNQPYFAGFP